MANEMVKEGPIEMAKEGAGFGEGDAGGTSKTTVVMDLTAVAVMAEPPDEVAKLEKVVAEGATNHAEDLLEGEDSES